MQLKIELVSYYKSPTDALEHRLALSINILCDLIKFSSLPSYAASAAA